MNLLVVSQYFWPEEFRINGLVLGLKERGHDVAVLTGKPSYQAGNFPPGNGFSPKGGSSCRSFAEHIQLNYSDSSFTCFS